MYLSCVRRANQHWAILGTATKVAMALGLARIPDEAAIVSMGVENAPPRWKSTIDREVGRRVWYCLVRETMLFLLNADGSRSTLFPGARLFVSDFAQAKSDCGASQCRRHRSVSRPPRCL